MGKRKRVPARQKGLRTETEQEKANREYRELCKNGITPEFVRQECEATAQVAFHEGWEQGATATIKLVYAGIVTMMHRHESNNDEIAVFLKEVDEFVSLHISESDAMDETFEETGLRIIMENDGVLESRVQEI